MSIYTNYPLLQGGARIRLVRIIPGSPTDQIQCEFSTCSINDAPRYNALSYEWGSRSHLKDINVIGQQIAIRSNLWRFLLRLRSHAYYDYLWCDAICIDQDNDRERNHQVQLMSQIYRRAHMVLVWLGEENYNSNLAIRTVQSLSICTDSSSRDKYLKEREQVWKGLAELSRRRYWTRIWIVQEITVARELELLCGGEKATWKAFATACKFPPDQLTPWATDLWAPLTGANDVRKKARAAAGRELYYSKMYRLIRSQRRWPSYIDTFEVLSARYEESGCEDVRDRIFALLAVSREVALGRGITVDYRNNMEETFFSLVVWGSMGPISIYSRLKFARLAARVMNLSWPGYLLECRIEFDTQRSPIFWKWVGQALPMAVRCRYLGKWTFTSSSDLMLQASIDPGLFIVEPKKVLLPLIPMEHTNHEFDLFGFETSDIFLACKPTGHRSWIVAARAYVQFDEDLSCRSFVPSIFRGLAIDAVESNRHILKLKNIAQFMEIFLDNLSSSVWASPANTRPPVKGAGFLARRGKDKEDRNLGEVLQGLKITSWLKLTEYDDIESEEGNSEEGETYEVDWNQLLAESEALARPRISRPPIMKPRKQRERGISSMSDVVKDSDPFCERLPTSYGQEVSSASPTLFLP
ncbi:hypothetical protein OIDMADRAFT_173399 [Oidiodendron maius Zn]|uniref:Heterokaryon incompatibility domain-containing protein n=1 Tax=Oidiodendron maius (strain Zn) TaxID=913774 RepID=A0A0C3C2N7_OIDMZ|nr:hypothetical protein OIDMADRAFT_173399 [Oidiodendron maius Zn]